MDDLGLLRKIVSMNSVFPDEQELAFFLAGELERAGFDVELQGFGTGARSQEQRYNVLASRGLEVGRMEEPVMLFGHMDTVPPYGYEVEGRDPLSLAERDGRLYGLGAYDMKAGIAAIVRAVGAVRDGRPLKVMFVSDEEADSRGCHAAAQSGWLRGVPFALTTEISDVQDATKPTRTIMLGRRGRAQYEIDVPGRSFHAARPSEGISAVTEASKLAIGIEEAADSLPEHPGMGQGSMTVRAFHSDTASLSIPDSATLLIDRHLVLPENAKSARDGLESIVRSLYESKASGLRMLKEEGQMASVKVKPRDVPYLMPYATPKDHPEVVRLAGAVRRALGAQAEYNYGKSVADENLVAMHGVPVASLGPVGGGEHSSGEWVSKRSYLELIEVLKAYIA
jgi:acetylornithine deacetylase/succinyl-diaminopimelate desuccinylase-like protein